MSTPERAPRLPGWIIESELGAGGHAVVYRVRREAEPAGVGFVAKVFRERTPWGEPLPRRVLRARLRREVQVMRTLQAARCPHVARVVDHDEGYEGRVWLVMSDYAAGPMCVRDHEGRIVRWSEPFRGRLDRVLEVTAALAEALACMHAHDPPCLHRDLHTSNVLFDAPGGDPVLTDFGSASLGSLDFREPGDLGDGPQYWRPPEFDAERWWERAVPASDVFMLGGLFYEALSGGWQPHASGEAAAMWPPDLELGRYTDHARAGEASALLERMLERRPERRPPAADVLAACAALRGG